MNAILFYVLLNKEADRTLLHAILNLNMWTQHCPVYYQSKYADIQMAALYMKYTQQSGS